jgi:hypothetical protein
MRARARERFECVCTAREQEISTGAAVKHRNRGEEIYRCIDERKDLRETPRREKERASHDAHFRSNTDASRHDNTHVEPPRLPPFYSRRRRCGAASKTDLHSRL